MEWIQIQRTCVFKSRAGRGDGSLQVGKEGEMVVYSVQKLMIK